MRMRNLNLAFVLAGVTACQGWQPVARPTPGGNLEGNPQVVRVTRTQGCGPTPSRECMANRGTVTLYGPRIQGDSLIGYFDRENRERAAIAVSDITNVEAQKVDKVRTTGAVVGGTLIGSVVLVTLGLLILLASMY